MALFVVDLRPVVRILRFRGKGVYQERMETKTTSTSKHQASCQREVRAAYLNVHMCTGSRSQTLKPKAKFSSNCLLYPPNHVVMLNVVSSVDEVKHPVSCFVHFAVSFANLRKFQTKDARHIELLHQDTRRMQWNKLTIFIHGHGMTTHCIDD